MNPLSLNFTNWICSSSFILFILPFRLTKITEIMEGGPSESRYANQTAHVHTKSQLTKRILKTWSTLGTSQSYYKSYLKRPNVPEFMGWATTSRGKVGSSESKLPSPLLCCVFVMNPVLGAQSQFKRKLGSTLTHTILLCPFTWHWNPIANLPRALLSFQIFGWGPTISCQAFSVSQVPQRSFTTRRRSRLSQA